MDKAVTSLIEAARAAAGWERNSAHGRAQVLYYLAENLDAQRERLAALLSTLSAEEVCTLQLSARVASPILDRLAADADAASQPASSTVENIASSLKEQVDGRSEGFSASANRLLGELKKAYAQILQEREEQIINLKEEVVDLKTLVRVLESENDRLQSSVYIYHQSDK